MLKARGKRLKKQPYKSSGSFEDIDIKKERPLGTLKCEQFFSFLGFCRVEVA